MGMRGAWVTTLGLACCGTPIREGEGNPTGNTTAMPGSSSDGSGDTSVETGSTGPKNLDTGSTHASSSDDGGSAEAPKLDVGGMASEDGGTGPVDECPCANVDDGIYVLNATAPASVWFYDPPNNQLSEVGVLGCTAPLGATANSMAIDRQGNAWVNYYSLSFPTNQGTIHRAPLDDLGSCADQGYLGDGEWFLMGMGYSVDVPGGSCDTLYLYNSDKYLDNPNFVGGSTLARYDEDAAEREEIGPTDYPVAELSGTGDARLFAFATVAANQSVLAELDKQDGSELELMPLDGLDITNGFAFAFWGGDVYFFTETFSGAGVSQITRLDYDGNDGGGLEVVDADTGLFITGAGVSTCASFEPPM